MSDPATLGTQAIKEAKEKYLKGDAPYINISVPSLYEKGWYPDFDLIKSYEEESEVVIVYPHYATEQERGAYSRLANDLSEKYKVLLYEASIEAGGGADVLQKAAFVYQQFQPVFVLATGLGMGLATNFIYDLLKNLYKQKNNPLLKKQYTIKRIANGVTYNYVFDGLSADEAISAGKLIPNQLAGVTDAFHDTYLRYDTSSDAWIEFKV